MLIIILIIFSKSMTFGNFSHNFTQKSLSPSAKGNEGYAPSTAPPFLSEKRGTKELED